MFDYRIISPFISSTFQISNKKKIYYAADTFDKHFFMYQLGYSPDIFSKYYLLKKCINNKCTIQFNTNTMIASYYIIKTTTTKI